MKDNKNNFKVKLKQWLRLYNKKIEDVKNDCQLFLIEEEEYGSKYKDHLFDQYKLYVEMTDRISQRRVLSNTFFLTANTGLLSVMSFVIPFLSYEKSDWNILFSFWVFFYVYPGL